MAKLDLQYTCTVMGNLSGIPIRIYKNGKLDFYHSLIALPKDPICVSENDILAVADNVGYFVDENFSYYGIVNSKNQKIVIGPTRQIPLAEQELKELAFKADTGENLSDFIQKEKIDEAKRLLRYTDKSLIAISSYLGFSSQSHFNRIFKSITGKTPKEYRLNG